MSAADGVRSVRRVPEFFVVVCELPSQVLCLQQIVSSEKNECDMGV